MDRNTRWCCCTLTTISKCSPVSRIDPLGLTDVWTVWHGQTFPQRLMPKDHWTQRLILYPLQSALKATCSDCSTQSKCSVAECLREAERIAVAVANTVYRNYDIYELIPDQRFGGYWCYEWAEAFEDAFELENPKCFSAEINRAIGGGDKDFTDTHYWVNITSACGKKSVFVDDGFANKDNKMVHDAPPVPENWKVDYSVVDGRPRSCDYEYYEVVHTPRNKPEPYCSNGLPNGKPNAGF